jgi:hypothetical protein
MTTKTAQTSVQMPAELAGRAGCTGSSWLRVGDGNWTGTIYFGSDETAQVVELAASWRAVLLSASGAKTVEARTLEGLVTKVIGHRTAKR